MHGSRARVTRTAWWLAYAVVVFSPLALAWTVGRDAAGLTGTLAVDTGLLAFSLLVVVIVLMSRVPSLVAAFGIETSLLMHRIAALTLVGLVAAHVVLVVLSDPRGLGILSPTDASRPATAAIVSTAALGLLVGLALWRKRRQPRYEGWRMLHVGLAVVIFVTAGLHLWWLDNLSGHPAFAALVAAMVLMVAGAAGRRWLWLPLRARRRSYRVEEVVPVEGDAVTVVVRAHGHGGLRFAPGQFAWLKIGASPFVFEEHPFTIASTAERPHRKEFTIKALGDFSELLGGLRPGRRVFLDGPYGGFTVEGLDSSPGFVLIAGGVGITPMLSILRTLADRGDRRHHRLLVGSRTAEDRVLRSEIEELRDVLDLHVVDVLESPPPVWEGESGRINGELLERHLPPRATLYEYFLCGPPPMVAAVGRHLRDSGISYRRIHTEQFEVI